MEPLRANYEVYWPWQHISSYEDYPEDKGIASIILVEHYNSLDVEEEWAHKQERDYDLEDRDEEEDVLESPVLIGRQRDRVHEVNNHNKD